MLPVDVGSQVRDREQDAERVGAGTHPGAGIPGVLMGAGVTAELVVADARVERKVAAA